MSLLLSFFLLLFYFILFFFILFYLLLLYLVFESLLRNRSAWPVLERSSSRIFNISFSSSGSFLAIQIIFIFFHDSSSLSILLVFEWQYNNEIFTVNY